MDLIVTVLQALEIAILIRVLYSWIDPSPYPGNAIKRVLWILTDPILEPLRRVIPPLGMFDISPIVALIGLFGIEEQMKIVFLLIGMVPYLISVVVDECEKVPNEILETAYTLGATRLQVLMLLFRASLAATFGAFIILYDIGWTYVILAEAVNAQGGLGYMVQLAYQHQKASWSFAGLLVIGGIGLLTDALIHMLSSVLFRWREKAA